MRRLMNGVEVRGLRLFWIRGENWRTKPHPYFFFRNWGDTITFQSGPFEMFYRRRR